MKKIVVLAAVPVALIALCCLSGCLPHSIGPKSLTPNITPAADRPRADRSVYVAVLQPLPADASDGADYIASQFAKIISLAARESFPGPAADSPSEALEAARDQGSDYLILLSIARWKKHTLADWGHKVNMDVRVYDVASARVLTDDTIEAVCRLMLEGLEQSPRECVRPQIDAWMNQTFGTDAHSDANTVPIRTYIHIY